MANYCEFEMRLKGKKEDIETFSRYMGARYDLHCKPMFCSEDRFFFRVFDHELTIDSQEADNLFTATIDGDCAWSVWSCFFEGDATYYSDFKSVEGFKGITLKEASKLLNLTIEVYSKELGHGFMEHFLVDHGEIIIEECYSDYYEEETEDGIYIEHGGVAWDFSF